MFIPLNFGLLFSPKDRNMLEAAHATVTKSYHHLQARKSPEWVQGMTLYEVFVRNYSNEGNFKNVMHDLPRLHDLGIKTIWLMPIHPIGQSGRKGRLGCPYSIQDYFAIHQDLGTSDDFRELVEAIHRLDMKILIDMVANHSSNDHVEMESHPDWFRRDRKGKFTRLVPDWSDVTDLNYDNAELRIYIKKTILHWVKKYDIDGYRCDVAGLVPLDFWDEVRDELDQIKPGVFLLAEGDHPEMHLHAFDATYDWDLYFKLEDIKNGKVLAEEALDVILRAEDLFPQNASRLRFIENHDMPRSMKLFKKSAYHPYATLIFTIPGIPLIYNGQEIGATRLPDLFKKESINWSKADLQIVAFHQKLIHLRQNHPQFSTGKITKINTNHPKDVIAFACMIDNKIGLVFLNFSNKRLEVSLNFQQNLMGNFSSRLISTTNINVETLLVKENTQIVLAPFDAQSYVNES